MTPLLVLGDSHGEVFRTPLFATRFPDHAWEVVIVPGATASGLENPNDSKTQAYPTFKRALGATTARRVIVSLGEVDTGHTVWARSQHGKGSVDALLHQAVDAYCRYISELARRCRLAVIGAPLPTLPDDFVPGDAVATTRRAVPMTQAERTALTPLAALADDAARAGLEDLPHLVITDAGRQL